MSKCCLWFLLLLVSLLVSQQHLVKQRLSSFIIHDVVLGERNDGLEDGYVRIIVNLSSSEDISVFNGSLFDNAFVALYSKDVYIIPHVTLLPPSSYVLRTRVTDSGQYRINFRTEWTGWPDSRDRCLHNPLEADRLNLSTVDARLTVITVNATRMEHIIERQCTPSESFMGVFYAIRDHPIPSSGTST